MTKAKENWAGLVCEETGYWTRTIAKNPAAFQGRLRRATPVNLLLPGLVDLLPAREVSILDVGSGPAPVVLGKYSKPVEFVACDPLAEEYRSTLEKYGIESPVKLIAADGERLTEHFDEDRFDITHIQNALDHSYDPVAVLQNMLRCTKPGGVVVVNSMINEGLAQKYHGLHQWNIAPGAGGFYIENKDGTSTAVGPLLSDQIELLLVCTYPDTATRAARTRMDAVIVKKAASADFLAGVEREFQAKLIERTETFARTLVERDAKLAEQHAEIERLRKAVQQARRRRAAIATSATYQIGSALVLAARSPWKIPVLPRDLVRIARARRAELSR